MSDIEFRDKVIASLARLEDNMYKLIGNGQPGRISNLEAKVRKHDRLIWMALGGAVVIGWGLRTMLYALFGVHA